MTDRIPVFELHILPMFRLIDIEHMALRRKDLTDYNYVSEKAEEILGWLSGSNPMPPKDSGGPWPEEWISLFTRWAETGMQRLSLHTAMDLSLGVSDNLYTLTCKTELPYFGAQTWLEIESVTSGNRSYRLVLEALEPPTTPTPFEVTFKERFEDQDNIAGVYVTDSLGTHFITIPTS